MPRAWRWNGRRPWQNLTGNRHAAFLFKATGPGFSGVRLAMELIRAEEEGDLLATIKANTDEIVGGGRCSSHPRCLVQGCCGQTVYLS